MVKFRVTTVMKALALLVVLSLLYGCNEPIERPAITAVAHAGGGVDRHRYTNSLEAMDYSFSRGFKLIEIDFSWTNDGRLVCLHDWKSTAKRLFDYRDGKRPDFAQFKALVAKKGGFTPCDLDSLNDWLMRHPGTYVITDLKGNKTKALEIMIEKIADARSRIIPQFTQPDQYATVRDLGFDKSIWTLFSYKAANEDLLREASGMNLFAITMPPARAKTKVAFQLAEMGISTYVHTINDVTEAKEYQNVYGLTSVYTDFLDIDFGDSDFDQEM